MHGLLLLVVTIVVAANIVSATLSSNHVVSSEKQDDKTLRTDIERDFRGNRFLRNVDDKRAEDEERLITWKDIFKGLTNTDDVASKKLIEMVDMRKFDDVAEKAKNLNVQKLNANKANLDKLFKFANDVDDLKTLFKFADDTNFLKKFVFSDWKAKNFDDIKIRESMKLDDATDEQISIATSFYKKWLAESD
ncbi:Something about silencing protein 10 [Phytophthora palmivora]|uniref:Something about silencing protein 10 n=1 Tax=Phytophthora palmivora TaxID=4796 RepID=A0A2P4Y2B1_9STRA|nr:Something about silencing protein 10 [Phytophthora palmivora]